MKKALIIFTSLFVFISVHAQEITGLAGWNIFLDPGHSRTENQGVFGYPEAYRNLDVALALRDMLLETTDIDTVYLSRTNDQQYVSLTQRSDMANQLGAAWFHSIHSDAGPPSANSTLLLWGQYRNGLEKVPNGGQAMSDIMIVNLTEGMRTYTIRGSIGDCSFYGCSGTGPYLSVNRRTTMPSELSESGFHTNPTQVMRFMNPDWAKLEAKTFYTSILTYFGLEKPFFGTVTGYVFDAETGVTLNGIELDLNGRSYVTDTYETVFQRWSNDPDELSNGLYYYQDLPDSTMTLVANGENYYADTLEVDIEADFFTFQDVSLISKRPPYIVNTEPVQQDTLFAAWDPIIIDFSRPMDAEAVVANLRFEPLATGIEIFWTNKNMRMIIRTDTLQYLTDYRLTLSGAATDRYFHPLDGNGDGTGGDDYELTFRTGPEDLTPPRLAGATPRPNARDVLPGAVINLEFDEEIDPATLEGRFMVIPEPNGEPVTGQFSHLVLNEQSIVSFFPEQPLAKEQKYKVFVENGIRDLEGNATETSKQFFFTTGDQTYSSTPIDDFNDGLDDWFVPQQSGSSTGFISERTGVVSDPAVVNLANNSQASMQLKVAWDTDASDWLIREYLAGSEPRSVTFDTSMILQVDVFGDDSGNLFRFAVDDNVPQSGAGNHEVSPWYTIDWKGWKTLSWDLGSGEVGSWIGDQILQGTMRFDSFQLSYVPGKADTTIVWFDQLRISSETTTAVHDPETANTLPDRFGLEQNYPNPFNGNTTIAYHLPAGEHRVSVKIYNIRGEQIRTLVQQTQSAGQHSVTWDARDQESREVASGIYLVRLQAGDWNQSKRMLFIK